MSIFELIVISLMSVIWLTIIIISIIYIKKKNKLINAPTENEFAHAAYVLNNIIENIRPMYQNEIFALKRKYGILNSNGKTTPPNDSIENYRNSKEKVKSLWSKNVLKSITKETRNIFLYYYSSSGFINYIFTELDKEV